MPNFETRSVPMTRIAYLLCLFAIALSAQATPLYYSFEGNITSIIQHERNPVTGRLDPTILPSSNRTGFSLGQPLNFMFLLDFDAPPVHVAFDGVESTVSDTTTDDYFYSELISGNLPALSGHSFADPYFLWERRQDRNSSVSGNGEFLGGIEANRIWLGSNAFVADWEIGRSVSTQLHYWYSDTDFENTQLDMRLVSIAEVPLPASAFLFVAGCLGLLASQRLSKMVSAVAVP